MGHGKKPEGEAGESRKERSFRGEFITFLVLFFILWLFSYILTLRFPGFMVLARSFIADEVAWCLSQLDYSFTIDGSTITLYTGHGGERLVVISECTGVYTTMIYLSIIGAYPALIRERFIGLLMGVPAIHLLNLIRMVFVALVLYHKPGLFDFVHGYLWQGSFLIFMFILVVFWMSRIVKPGRRSAFDSVEKIGADRS